MSVRTAAKGKIDMALEPSKIRESVMLSVIEYGANVTNRYLICVSYGNNAGMQCGEGQKYGKRM